MSNLLIIAIFTVSIIWNTPFLWEIVLLELSHNWLLWFSSLICATVVIVTSICIFCAFRKKSRCIRCSHSIRIIFFSLPNPLYPDVPFHPHLCIIFILLNLFSSWMCLKNLPLDFRQSTINQLIPFNQNKIQTTCLPLWLEHTIGFQFFLYYHTGTSPGISCYFFFKEFANIARMRHSTTIYCWYWEVSILKRERLFHLHFVFLFKTPYLRIKFYTSKLQRCSDVALSTEVKSTVQLQA